VIAVVQCAPTRLNAHALALAALALATASHAAERPGCGAGALIDLAATIGCPMTPAQEAQLVARYPAGKPVSMLDLTLAAADLGVELVGVEATVDELRTVHGPAILRLTDPDHFVTLLLRDDTHCQIADNGKFSHLPWDALAARYSGQALVLPQETRAGPRLRITPVLLPPANPWTQAQAREVVIANDGAAELAVSLLQTSCDCLTVVPNSLTIPPHGTERLVLEVLPEKPPSSTMRPSSRTIPAGSASPSSAGPTSPDA